MNSHSSPHEDALQMLVFGTVSSVYSQLGQVVVQGLIFGSQTSLEAEEVDSHEAGYTPHLL